ncbi:Uncharacterised protein [Streptococcus pneumoniae]|nr:Uncharacterised protein [Streptococcus pneumoniae]
MAEIQFNVNMDLVDKYVPAEDITIPQEDNLSVKFIYSIFNREIAEDLTGATGIVVSFVKPDGHIVLQSNGTLELPNKINIVANAQAFTYVGKVYMQVQYKKGAQTFNTRQAFFWVEKSGTSCTTVASSDYAPYLDNIKETWTLLSALDLQALIDSKQTAENAQTDVDALTPRVAFLEFNVSDLQVRMTNAESTNATHGARIIALENSQGSFNTRITNIETKNTQQDVRLNTLENEQSSQGSRLSAVETKNTTQDTRLTNLESGQSSLSSTVANNKSAQDSINAGVSNDINSINSRVTAAETKNSQQDARLDSIETKDAIQDAKISSIEGANSVIIADINALETLTGEHEGRLDINDSKNTSQDSLIASNTSAISSLTTTVTNNQTGMNTRVTALETAKTANDIKNAQQDGRLTALENYDVTQDTRMTAIETKNTSQDTEIANVVTSVSGIVTDVRLTEGVDSTSTIQTALDKKGWVRIVTPGTFDTGRLLIDDDTKFELMPGVTLRKKDGTNHYILVNKGHVQGYRNKNITVKGGKWLLNSTGNPNANGDLSTNPQSWPGIGILFNKVDNLTIESVEDIGGEWKYCYLIVDINKGNFKRINLNNESDGLHFEPPLANISIEDITGVTQDDLISFTAGDYPRYSLGQTGDFENIKVENVYGGKTTDELIKLVGSGIDGKSVFRNMYFKNIGGYADAVAVRIMKEDQAIANPCLKNTKLQNVVFENIDVKMEGTGGQPYFMVGAVSGDLTVRKLKVRQSETREPFIIEQCSLDSLILDDIQVIPSTGTENTSYIVGSRSQTNDTLGQLILKDSNIATNSSATGSIVSTTTKGIKNIIISNTKINSPAMSLIGYTGVNTDGVNLQINNSDIICNILAAISVKMNVSISNSFVTNILRTLHFSDGADARVLINNTGLLFSVNGMNATRKLSASGDLKASNLLTDFNNSQFGDRIIYDRPTDQSNKGIYNYNGTAWVKFVF